MTKEEFLAAASDLFDKLNPEVSEKITVSEDLFDTLVDEITDDLEHEDLNLIRDYDLTMSCKEVELDSISWDTSVIRYVIQNALSNHFTKK
jgi:hypothetical protein